MAEIVEEQCEKDLEYNPNGLDNRMKLLLYKMITFLDLIPLKQITLPKWGALEADASSSNWANRGNQIDPVYNNDNLPITVVSVNANWNCSIYIEETTVTGYFKHMPCGKGRTKLIKRFVKPHRRSAHERLAGKLKSASTTYGSAPKEVIKLPQKVMAIAANVAPKRIPLPMKDQEKGSGRKDHPKKLEPLNSFQAKLAELKKKFNGN
jgi:predicted nucleic acid binding AN1-type Zn finger protein